jgi:hypothetical protein
LLQEINQELTTKIVFPREKYWKHLHCWKSLLRGFTFHPNFFYFVDNEQSDEATHISRRLYKLKPIPYYFSDRLRSMYTTQCEMSVAESLKMWKEWLSWKVSTPSKWDRFGTNNFNCVKLNLVMSAILRSMLLRILLLMTPLEINLVVQKEY